MRTIGLGWDDEEQAGMANRTSPRLTKTTGFTNNLLEPGGEPAA